VAEIQGGQWGDHNIQVNLFAGEAPRGPVVAGNVPQAPPAFQPREDLMAQLRAAGPGVSVVRAVTGMRGVGKTQLAGAYARECIDAGLRLVAWVDAEDTPSILNGLAVVAGRLGIRRPGTDLQDIGGEVRNRLEADGDRCLLVFDNVTDPDAVRPYLPSAGKSQVVVTSTQASALALGKPTQVDVFSEQQSLDFLAERTGQRESAEATTLASELGHLPLALAQAAAVIAAQHLTYPVYLSRLRSYPAREYLPPAKGDPYPRGAAEAISLSVDAVTDADQGGLCRDLLGIVSLLSPEGVARQLLYHARPAGSAPGTRRSRVFPAPRKRAASSVTPQEIDRALGRLAGASLLTFSGDGEPRESVVTAHRLVMRVVRDRHAHDGSLTAVGTRACALLRAAAIEEEEMWRQRTTAREVARHVLALNDHLSAYADGGGTTGEKELAYALLGRRAWAASCLTTLGDDPLQAVAVGEPLLADCVRMLGEGLTATLRARDNLAAAYRAAGRLSEAIPLNEQTLAERVRAVGERSSDTPRARNNLATAYQQAGRVGEAIPLFRQALAGFERLLGKEHPDTLTVRNNLAFAHLAAGRVDEAIELGERTLADCVRVLGEDHPETLASRSYLASAYLTAKRVEEVVPLCERTLADCARLLGEDHPETLTARYTLAAAYRLARRPEEAIPLAERTLADRVRLLGDDHHETLRSRYNLAAAYSRVGRTDEALRLFEQALAGFERVLGREHPDTVAVREDLAMARQQAAGGERTPPA
jgi:tetratricopeptide (TPR) repeat protein